MRISDWSSDVCSSDLACSCCSSECSRPCFPHCFRPESGTAAWQSDTTSRSPSSAGPLPWCSPPSKVQRADTWSHRDRKSVVEGKSVYDRVHRGGHAIITQKTHYYT